MKDSMKYAALFLLFAVLTFQACGSGSDNKETPIPKYYAYVVNNGDSTVSSYSINDDGSLAPIGSSVSTGVNPGQITINPAGTFAFVINSSTDPNISSSISSYSINNDGSLALADTFIENAGGARGPNSVAVHPNGNYLYVAFNSGPVIPYSIGGDGKLTENITLSGIAGSSPFNIKIDPAGKFLYAANSGNSSISCFAIRSADGGLEGEDGYALFTTNTSGSALSLSIDPSGKNLYCMEYGSATVKPLQAFIIGTDGSLSANSNGSSFGVATGGYYSMTADPSGKFIYIINSSKSLYAFSVNSNGTLSEISGAFSTGASPYSITTDPSGRFVYVVNRSDNTVSAYSMNSTTGSLTSISTYSTGANPQSIITLKK